MGAVAVKKKRNSEKRAGRETEPRRNRAPAEHENHELEVAAGERRWQSGIDESKESAVDVVRRDVAEEDVAIALQQIEIPLQRRLHVLVAIRLRAVLGAEEDGQVDRGIGGEQAKKRILILNHVRRDDRDAVLRRGGRRHRRPPIMRAGVPATIPYGGT